MDFTPCWVNISAQGCGMSLTCSAVTRLPEESFSQHDIALRIASLKFSVFISALGVHHANLLTTLLSVRLVSKI